MTRHQTVASIVLSLCLAAAAAAQETLEPLFKIDVDSTLPWFTTDGNTRGMALVPGGSLLVTARTPATAIHRLDPRTGEPTGTLETAGISGGTYPVNKIVAAADGKIYVGNLASDGNPFRLYYYDSEEAAPTLAFELASPPGGRMGDGLAVTGMGASTKLLVTGTDNKTVLLLSDANGDGTFTHREITPSRPETGGVQEVAWDADDNAFFWLRQSSSSNVSAYRYQLRTGSGTGRAAGSAANCGPFDMARLGGETLAAVGGGVIPADGPSTIPGRVFSLRNATQPIYVTAAGLEAATAPNINMNGSGEAIIDAAGGHVYFLLTNNSISAWRLPGSRLASASR